MRNENWFLLLGIKEAAVLVCTCQINHILILAHIPRKPLSFAELPMKSMEARGKKEKKRKRKDIAIPSEVWNNLCCYSNLPALISV